MARKAGKNGGRGDGDAAIDGLKDSLAKSASSLKEAQASVGATEKAAPNREGIGFLGEVAWLMAMTKSHQHYFLADLEWLVIPPVALRQFRLWRKDNLPVGYASWAMVNDEVDARFRKGIRRLAPAEWKSGEHLWLIDLMAPMGGAQEMVRELKTAVFPNKNLNFFGSKGKKE